MKKKTKVIILGVVAFITVVYFGVSLLVAHMMTVPLAPRIEISPEVISKNFENITFQSSDGLKLEGWFFEGKSNKLIIMVSGLLPNRSNIEYLAPMIGKELISSGYSVLMYDTRSHGVSEGKRVGYGSVEGKDVLGAVFWGENQGFDRSDIGILADSTGAISTLMVIDKLDGVGPIILDSASVDFQKNISNGLWKEKFIPLPLHPTIFFFTKNLFGVDISSIKTIDKVMKVPERRFLFLHGKLDETIPIENSKQLHAKSNKNSKLVIFEEGHHIETYKSDPSLYRKEVFGFLTRGFGK